MEGYVKLLNTNREKPPIPKIPRSQKKLNELLGKDFKVLYESEPISEHGGEYHPGGVALTNVELECPFCGMKFKAVRRSGCFLRDLSPSHCPNCNFPDNILRIAMRLLEKKTRSLEKKSQK